MARQKKSLEELADNTVFTTGEAADVCKVSQQTIIRCFDAGRLDGFRVPGSKFRRIPRASLLKFMRANDIPTDILEKGPRRILVVDDEQEIVTLISDVLGSDERYEVMSASNGYDAGMLTESFKPHLIVLDYMLPDLNGDLVCQRIKGSDTSKDTKVLFISGVVAPDEIERLQAAGADEFIKKPFDIEHLADRIGGMLGFRKAA
ncbi:MAG: response regulator [Planctomycetota bacterium]|jgi:excisionase family DNA binding protein